MSRANPTWGSLRMVGELQKLGIEVAKSTIEKYRLRPRKPPLADLVHLPEESRAGPRGPGFLCRADGHQQGAVRLTHSRAPSPARRAFQRDRASHRAIDGPAGDRCLSLG